MGLCYVIMPYGGENATLQAKFEGVYQTIIRNAAGKAGFDETEIIRQDHKGDAGLIIRNVVDNLARGDIIIADVSEGNANVMYELGIAHVFHKKATVMICEKGERLPFDLQSLTVVEYSTQIEMMAESVAKIEKAIKDRLYGTGNPDNIVHLTVNELPVHLLASLQTSEESFAEENRKLQAENAELRRRLEAAGLGSHKQETLSVRDMLQGTKAKIRYSGDAAVEQLRIFAKDGNWDEFLDFLAEFVEVGFPSKSELSTILELCDEENNPVLTQTVLEAALHLFPKEENFMTKLAKLYAGHPATEQKARQLMDRSIGIERNSNGEVIAIRKAKLDHNTLARMFDAYLKMGAYDDLIDVAEFLRKNGPTREQQMYQRNILLAYIRSGKLKEAAQLIDEINSAENSGKTSDVLYYTIASYYAEIGDHATEMMYLEKAMISDPDDDDYPLMIAGTILDEDLVRVSETEFAFVPRRQAQKAAAAFLYYIIENNRGNVGKLKETQHFAQRNEQLVEFFEDALPFIKGETDELPYEKTDRFQLDFCLQQM